MRRRAMETAGTPVSTFSPASFQSAQNLRRSPYSQNATLFLSSRRKNAKTAGTLNVLPRIVPIHAEPPPLPHTRRTPRFSSLRGEKRESSRNVQRSPSHRSNPRRPSAAPLYSQNATLFLSSRRKARKQPERSTFSPAGFQSTQNLRRSLRLHYLTFHKRQGHAKERQL